MPRLTEAPSAPNATSSPFQFSTSASSKVALIASFNPKSEELIRSSLGQQFQDGISRNVSSIKGEFLVISMFCYRDDPSDLLKTCKQTIFGCICNFTSRYGRDSEVSSLFYYSLSTKAGTEDLEMLQSVRLCTVYLKV